MSGDDIAGSWMFIRLLFVLLVALNCGAGAWLLFGRAPEPVYPPATDPGVPELELLPEAQSAAALRRGPGAAVPASRRANQAR